MLLTANIEKKSFGTGPEEHLILSGIGFQVDAGEIAVLFGPSGCGKSTLLRIIAGLDPDYSGAVSLDGSRVHRPTRRIGLAVQTQVTFDWLTVEGNIEFGSRYLSEPVHTARELAAIVGLGEKDLKKYPKQISGGMKQRMAFARTLAADPAVVLLDEPFSSLDYESREALQEVALSVRDQFGTAFVCVTHDPEEAVALGDRVLVMTRTPSSIMRTVSWPLRMKRSADWRYSPAFQEAKRELREVLAIASSNNLTFATELARLPGELSNRPLVLSDDKGRKRVLHS